MEGVKTEKFLQTLSSIGIDLDDFPDLSFGGLSLDHNMQYFIEWFCNNINKDNVLSDEERAAYDAMQSSTKVTRRIDLNDYPSELDPVDDVDEISAVEESLREYSNTLDEQIQKAIDFEKRLKKQELSAKTRVSDCKNDIKKFSVEDLCSDLEAVLIQKWIPYCVSFEPDAIGFDKMDDLSAKKSSALHQYHEKYITEVEIMLEKEKKLAESNLDKETLVECEYQEILSKARLFNQKTPTRDEAASIVDDLLIQRNKVFCKRSTDFLKYLHTALMLEKKLLLKSLSDEAVTAACLERSLSKTKVVAGSVPKVLNRVNAEMADLVKVISHYEVWKTSSKPNNSAGLMEKDKLSERMDMCVKLVEKSPVEILYSETLRERVSQLLSFLRTGPTISPQVVPMRLRILLSDCQSKLETLNPQLRREGGVYATLRENWKFVSSELWVQFLLDYHKQQRKLMGDSVVSVSQYPNCDQSFRFPPEMSFMSALNSTRLSSKK